MARAAPSYHVAVSKMNASLTARKSLGRILVLALAEIAAVASQFSLVPSIVAFDQSCQPNVNPRKRRKSWL